MHTPPFPQTHSDGTTPLLLHRWTTPLDAIAHDHRDLYVERFVLPLLGPSSLWLLRLAAHAFDDAPSMRTTAADLGSRLGLNRAHAPIGRNATIWRTLHRLVQYGYAVTISADSLALRARCPWLADHEVRRLPRPLAVEHQQWVHEWTAAHPADAAVRDALATAGGIAQANLTRAGLLARITRQLDEHPDPTHRFDPQLIVDTVIAPTAA